MLTKIISGGQTGVDQAALRAARRLGIPTGGWAPHGWKTQDGPASWLADYGLVEHPGDYAARTAVNVFNSDVTVRIARDFQSPGELCTMKAIKKYKKLWMDVFVQDNEVFLPTVASELLEHFLIENKVRVLNVAGNAEKTAPGIGQVAEKFLTGVFSFMSLST